MQRGFYKEEITRGGINIPSRGSLRAFTLVELLVVIGVIAVLIGISLPVLNKAKQTGLETSCKSNLRQMGVMLQTYTSDHNGQFPNSRTIYHAQISFDEDLWPEYYPCCRWHDARMAQQGVLLREHPELQGALTPYIANPEVLTCKVGEKANELRGCWNACPPRSCCPCSRGCRHDGSILVETQYTYTMNRKLGSHLTTVLRSEAGRASILSNTIRTWSTRRQSQVTRSPSQVFAFGEQNSWAVNRDGRQPLDEDSHWPAPFDLSGRFYLRRHPDHGSQGTLRLGGLNVLESYRIEGTGLESWEDHDVLGDCFATYHRPPRQDLNMGYSFVVMLDGHVEKVTVADQLRQSRLVPSIDPGRLLPGGNVTLAWPLDVPPPGEWSGQ